MQHREHRWHMLLLAGETRMADWGGPAPAPHTCLGPVNRVSDENDSPMTTTWRSRYPLNTDTYRQAPVTA